MEAETVDELAPEPVEKVPVRVEAQQEKSQVRPKSVQGYQRPAKSKAGLPSWLLWVGGAMLVVVLLVGGVSLLASDRRGSIPTEEPTEEVIAQVDMPSPTEKPAPTAMATPLPTATATKTSTATRTPTITPTPEPTLGIGSTMVNPVDGAVLVYVPEGEFLMGSDDEDAPDNEKPQRLVYLDAFWIYQHPVTNSQFADFVDVSGYQTIAEEIGWSWVAFGAEWVRKDGVFWGAPEGSGSSITLKNDHPVVQVSWFDADAYCQWVGAHLPTEAEWEKAARGTDGCKFPWGDENPTCDLANFRGCFRDTSPVGYTQDGLSPYGALDMSGNVWEWVVDWYDEDYYSRAPSDNPIGPTSGTARVVRGGSWNYLDLSTLRVSFRAGYVPDIRFTSHGFRCVLSEAP